MTARRIAYEAACDVELAEWNTQIVLLKAKAERADAEIRMACRRSLDALQVSQENAKLKQVELKAAGVQEWEGLKDAMDQARMIVRTSFCGVAAKLG
jgi:hypothetical protein